MIHIVYKVYCDYCGKLIKEETNVNHLYKYNNIFCSNDCRLLNEMYNKNIKIIMTNINLIKQFIV